MFVTIFEIVVVLVLGACFLIPLYWSIESTADLMKKKTEGLKPNVWETILYWVTTAVLFFIFLWAVLSFCTVPVA